MKRLAGWNLALALTLAACGSSDGGGSASEQPASESAPASAAASVGGSENAAAPSVNPDDPLGFGEEANTAVVVVGDQRYEFGDLYCVSMGGALGASSVGGDPQVNIDIPPEDWETSNEGWDAPSIRISGDDPYLDLRAGGEIVSQDARIDPSTSQVDSFSSDGVHASGTAIFIDYQAFTLGEQPEPMTATFEVTCGG